MQYGRRGQTDHTGKRTEIYRKNIERILSAVTESGFDLRAVPTVFMGGGSAILKRHVTAQDAICRPVFIEDVHANATGYERIVEQMWAR